MSATDSDNSIDWLASDTEDNNSEQEFERKHSQTDALSTDSRWSREIQEASTRGPPSSCMETWSRDAIELCKTQGEKMKRRRSFTEEDEGRLISNQSEKGRLFTQKCMELQCYIQPLSSILNGLRSGRYRERLSSFQESVAMDRIQRILGVLQNPCLGEKYISIILKMEEMLKSWFPNVKPQHQQAITHAEEVVPTKKLKLSPVTHTEGVSPVTISDTPVGAKPLRVTDLTPPGAYSASNLKWLHTSPICSPTAEQAQAGPRHVAPPRDITQDSAVSSSTDIPANTDSVPRGPPPGKINAPCLERLLKSTESIITRKGTSGLMDSIWS
ncbi:circadian-associated transcriptional repressor isoform X2 [Dunckerocampus dactyliophorus]|uniref:circadian-associated transcriptional repressor isoform X2 n=1 Tax=Dunckerocampus dactyliophorus TaxID=161453 RepID=UPI002404F61B|nr:circadian-associated transcriptional repressor isoform X2 [Dunckerocampus dactyliophorus]